MRLIRKVRCPHHDDRTASLAIYENGEYCFGCGYASRERTTGIREDNKEDLDDTFKYINALPRKLIRGLELPYDEQGYYVVWSGDTYYKFRMWEGDARYKSPYGHTPPLFWARKASNDSLVIIEGEINALSLNILGASGYDIVSPGASTKFYGKGSEVLLTESKKYNKVVVVADEDAAGWKAAVKLHMRLPKSEIKWMAEDANELLTKYDKETARSIIKALGL